MDFKDPTTGRRRQEFFERKSAALARREALLGGARSNQKELTQTTAPHTVDGVVRYWLKSLPQSLKESTRHYYEQMARYIVSPTPIGTRAERRQWSRCGSVPIDVAMLPGLGSADVEALTAPMLRAWHAGLVTHVGYCTAQGAKKVLAAALRLAGEDLHMRAPPIPRIHGRKRGDKQKKRTLSVQQVALLAKAAWQDHERGLYYAFPFLTGVRPSEQLGLLWGDINFEKNCISICRMQELDGTLCNFTKTEASRRDIPMPPLLRQMLLRWKSLSPSGGEAQARVFVTQGTRASRRHPHSGAPLSYFNFRQSYWIPALKKLGLPCVSPHSARHTFISTLQAQGTEVALVAKLAGHSNPNITLSYYSQAVRGGEGPLQRLEDLFIGSAPST